METIAPTERRRPRKSNSLTHCLAGFFGLGFNLGNDQLSLPIMIDRYSHSRKEPTKPWRSLRWVDSKMDSTAITEGSNAAYDIENPSPADLI